MSEFLASYVSPLNILSRCISVCKLLFGKSICRTSAIKGVSGHTTAGTQWHCWTFHFRLNVYLLIGRSLRVYLGCALCRPITGMSCRWSLMDRHAAGNHKWTLETHFLPRESASYSVLHNTCWIDRRFAKCHKKFCRFQPLGKKCHWGK